MARTWLSISVELLGGRGESLWPYPGRIFAVGPAHTFADLADAINTAFARWDRAHLDLFTLADGSLITAPETGAELSGSAAGGIVNAHDISSTKVARTVKPGEELKFTFDLGDDWVHRCLVADTKVDPMEVLGIRPKVPLPYWGWGTIPDQYGRRTAGDDGQSPLAQEPEAEHPMATYAWPPPEELPRVDLAQVRAAVIAGDAEGFLDAIMGRPIDDALQQISAGLPMALEHGAHRAERVTAAVYNQLSLRAWPGDGELAADLLARLRGAPLEGREVPVDLGELAEIMGGVIEESSGGHLDLSTGRVYPDLGADPDAAEGDPPDTGADPDRWLWVERVGSRAAWQDMADFTERQSDELIRGKLEVAIDGTGAFRRFKDVVYDSDLGREWDLFAGDRACGRARAFLAAHGIRAR